MELKPLLKLLRAQGVLKYKTPELELELSESVPQEQQDPQATEAAFPEDRELTYDERLYYSATPPNSSEEPEN